MTLPLWQDLPAGCDWTHGNFRSLLDLASYAARHGGYQVDPDVAFQTEPSPTAFAKLKARLDKEG